MTEQRLRARAMLVTNPAAGERHAKAGDLERCEAILRNAGFVLDRIETGAESPTSAELARRAIDGGYEACIVAGGDGTVAPAAAALLHTPVVLGILPFGSVMNIANGLGIPLGKIFFETAGIGLDAEMFGAARHAERGDWRRALRRAWRWATQQSCRVAIGLDGREDIQRALQVLVMNCPYYGWSLELLPEVSFIAVWRGGRLPVRPVVYRGAHIKISSDEPVAVHADGVLAGGLPAEFLCRKGALSVFA